MAKRKSKKAKVVTGIKADLSNARPTKIPQAKVKSTVFEGEPISFKTIGIHLGIIVAIVAVTYVISMFGKFVFQDQFLEEVLSSRLAQDSFWSQLILRMAAAPLSQSWLIFGFAQDFQAFGVQPAWYHFVNVVLHAASCLYFYCLVFLIARRHHRADEPKQFVYQVPLIASAMLACHPLAAESVAHITGREGVLVACNYFLALIAFVFAFWAKTVGKMLTGYLISILFFVMGIWSGPVALSIPAAGLCVMLLLRPDYVTRKEWLAETWPEIAVLLLLIIGACLLPLLGVSTDFANNVGAPIPAAGVYLATQFKALLVYYLRCFVVPAGLSVLPPFLPASGWFDPFTWLGAAVIGLTGWALYKLKRNLLPAFGLCIFLTSFLPPALLVQSELVADRRFYVPLAGLCLTVAWYIVKDTVARPVARVVVPVVLCLVLSGLTIWRNTDWFSDLSLWRAALTTNQTDPYAKAMLARALLEAGKVDEAKKEGEFSIGVDKDNPVANLVMGRIKLDAKLDSEAQGFFATAVRSASERRSGVLYLREAQIGLATAFSNAGQFDQAKDVSQALLLADRNNIQGNLLMGKSLIGLNQPMLALNFLNTGYKMDQSNVSYLEPIAEAGLATGVDSLVGSAYGASSAALQVAPTQKVKIIYAKAALMIGRFSESESMLDTLVKEQPNNAEFLYLKSLAEKEQGKTKDAEALSKKALSLDPKIKDKVKIKIFTERIKR